MKKIKKNYLFFIIKQLFTLFILFIFSLEIQSAERTLLSIRGKNGFPYFDEEGKFNIVYINPSDEISIATVEEQNSAISKMTIHDIDCSHNVNSILAKSDRAGKIWLIWEEKEVDRGDICVAQLINKKLINKINLTDDEEGFNFSPNIDFSFNNHLWITWVNYSRKKYTVFVKNFATNQVWEVYSSPISSAHSPHIIIDGSGKIWIFWVGQLRKHDEILYSFLKGGKWLAPLTINQNHDVPHLNPSLSLDYNGFPHLVWSAYDGSDYEIYYTHWDGNEWLKEKAFTENQNITDTSPSISLFLGTIPVVVWLRCVYETQQVCLNYKIGEEWGPEISLFANKIPLNNPKIASFGEKIGVSWQTETEIKAVLINFYQLQELFFLKLKYRDFTPILHPNSYAILSLDENKYIGFGDSITYGVIAYEPAPDKGYIPRLERLIDENLGESQVVNQGVGGEMTSGGLSRITAVINKEQAKAIFLMEGTNDVKDYGISMDTAAFNLKEMAQSCLKLGMTVFLASIIPKDLWEGIIKERILELNEKIRAVASDLKIDFVDQFGAFFDYPDDWHILYSDATHPNEQGYQLMAETWFKSLSFSFPSIEIDKTSLSFNAIKGEPNPSPQKFSIRNSGDGTLNYQITEDKDWLGVSPQSGDSKGEWDEIEVSVNISNLSLGDYEGHITITSDNASNSPQQLKVELTVQLPPLFSPLNFRGKKIENRSLALLEYINILNWEKNPQNKDIIEKYRIYLIEGKDKIALTEVDEWTLEYWHRRVNKNKVYTYGLTAIDEFGRESEVVYIEVR